MAKKGHKRRMPTAIKELNGTRQKCRDNPNEPKPDPTRPDPPPGMSAKALEHWDVVAPQLHSMGVLSQLDATALQLYCETFAVWKEASEAVSKYGPVANNNGRYQQSPYLAAAFQAQKEMRQLLAEFGMTPSSRSGITVPDGQDKAHGVPAFRSVS